MKVFGTGLQRTGTMSLTRGLNELNIKTIQFPRTLWGNIDDDVIHRFDGFTDFPVPLLYRELDRAFPGSKFVHTVRDEDAWIRSVHWLFTTGAKKFEWHKQPIVDVFHKEFYGVTSFDEKLFRERARSYNREVRDYFADRPDDFLVIDLTAGEGFERLCPFLGMEEPAAAFPHLNRKVGLLRVVSRKIFRV